MNPGDLRHRVTLQRLATSEDEALELVTEWVDVATVWASVKALSARELIQSQAMQSAVSVRIIIRYRDDVTADMRIIHRGAVYNIHGVIPDPDSGLDYLTLPCSTGNNTG